MRPLTTRQAKLTDVPFMLHLSRVYSREIGFLPKPALEHYIQNGVAFMAFEDNEPAGSIIGMIRLGHAKSVGGILQAAVPHDLRRKHIGAALLQHALMAMPAENEAVQCWCADDLPANDFWKAMGFTHTLTSETRGKRNRRRRLYRIALQPHVDLMGYVPPTWCRPGGIAVVGRAANASNARDVPTYTRPDGSQVIPAAYGRFAKAVPVATVPAAPREVQTLLWPEDRPSADGIDLIRR